MRQILYRLVHARMLRKLAELRKTEWLSPDQIERLQRERLERLLLHAYEKSPFYRRALSEAGVVRDSVVDLSQFSKAPLLDKQTLMRAGEDLACKGYVGGGKTFWNASGGSTGEPVRFLQDEETREWAAARKHWFAEWAGKSLGEREAVLWGSERDLLRGGLGPLATMRNVLGNRIVMNAFRMDLDHMAGYAARMSDFKPVHILAYADVLYELAMNAEQKRWKLPKPRSIMTSATTLYPFMRETIERVFEAPVFNRYGSRELDDVACECEHHSGLHISALTHFVEVLRPDGSAAAPGELGEIVVTYLTNYSMPLIRYRIGDMGAWSEDRCACGRGLPLLREVSGRTGERLVKTNGGMVTNLAVAHFVGVTFNQGWVRKFQVVQKAPNDIRVYMVPKDEVVDPHSRYHKNLAGLAEALKRLVGEDCHVTFTFVDDIPPTPSGKHRFLICEVRG